MKTKKEIIEIVSNKYNSKNRSVIEKYKVNEEEDEFIDEECRYIGKDGRECAFAMFCTDEAKKDILPSKEGGSASSLLFIFGENQLLLSEYHGHDTGFWDAIQSLHDYTNNWNETGLSKEGKKYVKDLISLYDETISPSIS